MYLISWQQLCLSSHRVGRLRCPHRQDPPGLVQQAV